MDNASFKEDGVHHQAVRPNHTTANIDGHNFESKVLTSQVPQPTCFWKWVGSTIPLKQDNLTLQASRAFNMARTPEEVYFLE